MQGIWVHGEGTVGAVSDELNAASRRRHAYTTVMTVMVRRPPCGAALTPGVQWSLTPYRGSVLALAAIADSGALVSQET